MVKKCQRCGTEALPEYKFCLKCGGPLPASGSESAMPAASERKKGKLVLIKGEGGETASYGLGGSEHFCGRQKGVVLFPDDDTVSPLHTNFFYRDNRLLVKDMGSVNGTYIRIKGERQLREGDFFICGEEIFICHEGLGTVPIIKDRDGTSFHGTPAGSSYIILQQVLAGGKPGAVFNGHKPMITIGREGCDFSFPDDRFMSHHHSTLENRDGDMFLIDGVSRNGTFFRLRPDEEQELSEGDLLFIGRQLLKVVF
jgi:pSer/pThr/pTyr-binding forkhead associated (FHA) protein